MARRFGHCTGIDVSSAHLAIAAGRAARRGISNVAWHCLRGPDDFGGLGAFDIAYSLIALQHNPPPLIAYFLRALLATLVKGGVAYVQVPVYIAGYQFEPDTHSQQDAPSNTFGMHALPQRDLFAIVEQATCTLLEVIEDDHAGREGVRSNVLLVKKR